MPRKFVAKNSNAVYGPASMEMRLQFFCGGTIVNLEKNTHWELSEKLKTKKSRAIITVKLNWEHHNTPLNILKKDPLKFLLRKFEKSVIYHKLNMKYQIEIASNSHSKNLNFKYSIFKYKNTQYSNIKRNIS